VTVQPESATTTDVDPSPTVTLQVLERKPEALNLNSPLLSALPVAVDSGEVTVIVAFARASLPSTVSVPESSEAFLTLRAASAAEVVTVNAARTTSDATATTLRPPANRRLECFMVSLPIARRRDSELALPIVVDTPGPETWVFRAPCAASIAFLSRGLRNAKCRPSR
jgi:hypothetical protein